MDERRTSPRRRTFYRGTICHSNRSVSLDCTVRDVSTGGVRLELSTEMPLPETFELTVPQLDLNYRAVRIMWARQREVGVRFEQAAEAAASSGTLAERVARLEHDMVKLNRQFAELRVDIKRYRNEE